MYIIVGLGNPGRKYEKTKHNAGFIALDMFAKRHGVSLDKEKFEALYCKTRIDGEDVLLVKPQTYMNLSGKAVSAFVNFFKIPPENLVVVYDDVELELGVIRIRAKGSAGTHNGMRNIVQLLHDTNFPRMRIGVGNDKTMELYEYVLAPFSEEQLKDSIYPAAETVCDALDCFIKEGVDKAMNKYNPSKNLKNH